MCEDLEQLGALFCAFFIVFAYDYAQWVYQCTSFVFFYVISVLRSKIIIVFMDAWGFHVFVAASVGLFISRFILTLKSPDINDEEEETYPLIEQFSDRSLLLYDSNDIYKDEAEINDESGHDVMKDESVVSNENGCLECEKYCQISTVKSCESNVYIECQEETIEVPVTKDSEERQGVHEVCSENAARSTLQTTTIDGDVNTRIRNNNDMENEVLFHSEAINKDIDEVNRDSVRCESKCSDALQITPYGSRDVHDNSDAKDDKISNDTSGHHDNIGMENDIKKRDASGKNVLPEDKVICQHDDNDLLNVVKCRESNKSNVPTRDDMVTVHQVSTRMHDKSIRSSTRNVQDYILCSRLVTITQTEIMDSSNTSDDGELTLCPSTFTLVSETAKRLADLLLSSSSCSSILTHDFMDDTAAHEKRFDELELKYLGKRLASIAGCMSVKLMRRVKMRIIYKDPNSMSPSVDVSPWGVALVQASKRYMQSGFIGRKAALPPYDTMYDQLEKYMANVNGCGPIATGKWHYSSVCPASTVNIPQESDVNNKINYQTEINSVDNRMLPSSGGSVKIPSRSQVVIGAGFATGLCLLCWKLSRA